MSTNTTTYVLDTSVLIADPLICKSLSNSQIVIPIVVLEELDKRKKFSDESGRNARVATRMLDEISNLGDISVGVQLENGSIIKIDTKKYSSEQFGNSLYGDNVILACAYELNSIDNYVVLLTNDINLRIRAKSSGVASEGYEKGADLVSELYSGEKTYDSELSEEAGENLISMGWINPQDYEISANPHQFIKFLTTHGDTLCYGRYVSDDKIKLVEKKFPWDLKPRNLEQELAMDLLLDNDVSLVSLVGKSGSGKTTLAIACAMQMVLEEKRYNKIIIFKSMQPLDKAEETGFLPGNLQEKLAPIFSNIDQAFEFLFTQSKNGKKNQSPDKWRAALDAISKRGLIEYQPLTYIRGQSIKDAIVILDETQNISKSNIKSFLTRAGENTKVILTGDIDQIDNDSLDPINNGLTQVIDKFKTSYLAGNLVLNKCERSMLAEEAVKLL